MWYIASMNLAEIREKAQPVFKKRGIKHAAVFGSATRGEDRPDSDIDLLVDLGNTSMGMIAYMDFIEEMEKALGKRVDMVTSGSSNKFLKPYIEKDLETIYEG